MKELIQIIESLHRINQSVIEKDNIIDSYNELVRLFNQLITDQQFKKSELYLDFKTKYLNRIEEKMKSLNQMNIVIEPLYIAKNETKTSSSSRVNGPVMTDIYNAPRGRQRTIKKTSPDKKKTETNLNITIKDAEENDENHKNQYIEFEYKDHSYYILNQPDPNNQNTHKIYNDELQLSGHLKGSQIVIIDNSNLEKSDIIDIPVFQPSSTPSSAPEKFLGKYIVVE